MSPYIPPKTIRKMQALGISESTVLDVFSSGEFKTANNGAKMATKKYGELEIGLFYGQIQNTGQYIITTDWKRERR